MNKSNSYNTLIQKLNTFTRKYYTSQWIKGSLLFIGLNLFLFILFNVAESQFYFSSVTRKVLFYSGLFVMASTFIYWVVRPMMRIFNLGQTITYDEAARIIGSHFPSVNDKLLNILQLARQSDEEDNDLLFHSIEQKTDDIKLVSFPKAIDLRKNQKYLKYALPPLLLLIVLLFSAPTLITDSSYRLFHNNLEFEREAPFTFQLNNTDLSLPQFEDIEIVMQTQGNVQPEDAYISIDNFSYKMIQGPDGQFSYTLKNVGQNTPFSFTANGFSSATYNINVLKKPSLARMNVRLDYPAYTQITDKSLNNEGDLVIPAGTQVTWTFDTENMSELYLNFGDLSSDTLLNTKNNIASYQQRIYRNTDYKLIFNSTDIPEADSLLYDIKTIPDEYPKISIQNQPDSQNLKIHYLIGEASDDYGIQKLTYNYAIVPEGADPNMKINFQRTILKDKSGKATTYDKIIDVSEYNLSPGASLWYYFEVFDNDGIQGSKSSKTPLQKWTQKTVEEFEELEEATEESIKSNLSDLLKEQKEIKKTAEELRNKLLQEKEVNWQRKKEIEKLIETQQSLQQKLDETQQMHEKNQQNREEFKESNPESNQEIQKMMEQAQNPKLQELMEKIQQLMDKMNKDEAIKQLEEMSNQMNQSEMDLERLEQLYNKLEMESDLMDQMEKLEKLAEMQNELAEENLDKTEESTEEDNATNEEEDDGGEDQNKEAEKELSDESNAQDEQDKNLDGPSKEEKMEKQKKINEEFDKISKELEDLFEKNQELKQPVDMQDPKTPSEEIKKDQKESIQNMETGSPQDAGQKQKDAGQKMQEMAESMKQQMEGGQQEQMKEDIQALRQVLENLVKLSFDQEDLIDEIAPLSYATPQYVDKVRRQFDLKNNFTLIRDSLLALANRNPKIEGTVTEKINLIDTHLEKSIHLLEEQEKSDAGNDQRRTMKNVNDLALMLTEALQNMQMEMSSANSMCQNPGSNPGSVPMDKITEGQNKLTKEMKDMAEKRKKGEGGKMSKDFAQTAAEQAAMRKLLEAKQQELMEQGKGSKQLQQLIDMMNTMETDLVNKKLTNEMMQRQQEILTRLLEAEKAERQQEMDEQRKAEQAKEIPKSLPPELQKYLDQRREEITPYQKLSPSLKPYYKQLVEEYYDDLKTR